MKSEEHTGQHQECPPCYRIKLANIQIQGIDAGQRRFTDRERARDMTAYQTMRRQGIQPAHVYGSAEIQAQATTAWEVEHATIMSNPVRKEFLPHLEASA